MITLSNPQTYASYKRLTWNTKTQDESEKNGKRYSMQTVTTREHGVTTLIPTKQALNQKRLQEQRTLYIKKSSILQEDTTIINTDATNDRPWKYKKQKLTVLKGEIHIST